MLLRFLPVVFVCLIIPSISSASSHSPEAIRFKMTHPDMGLRVSKLQPPEKQNLRDDENAAFTKSQRKLKIIGQWLIVGGIAQFGVSYIMTTMLLATSERFIPVCGPFILSGEANASMTIPDLFFSIFLRLFATTLAIVQGVSLLAAMTGGVLLYLGNKSYVPAKRSVSQIQLAPWLNEKGAGVSLLGRF